MTKVKKTVSLNIETYNESLKKMRMLRINDFSKYVDFILRENADPIGLAAAMQRHHQRKLVHYTELRNTIEEQITQVIQ